MRPWPPAVAAAGSVAHSRAKDHHSIPLQSSEPRRGIHDEQTPVRQPPFHPVMQGLKVCRRSVLSERPGSQERRRRTAKPVRRCRQCAMLGFGGIAVRSEQLLIASSPEGSRTAHPACEAPGHASSEAGTGEAGAAGPPASEPDEEDGPAMLLIWAVHIGSDGYQVPSGWTVFQIPSTRAVPEIPSTPCRLRKLQARLHAAARRSAAAFRPPLASFLLHAGTSEQRSVASSQLRASTAGVKAGL
jgi:hypothetical protein